MVVVSATARILKMVSPRFDNMVALEAQLKGRLRYLHSRVIANSEEIGFYQGHRVEHSMLRAAFASVIKQSFQIQKARIPYVAVEQASEQGGKRIISESLQFLMKYVWSGAGMIGEHERATSCNQRTKSGGELQTEMRLGRTTRACRSR